jgi:hypothetical protein
MPISSSIPTIVSAAILKALEKRLVYSRLFNKDYSGDVTPGGTVKIISTGAATIGTYTRDSDISWQGLDETGQDLAIDQQKYYAVKIDDIDKVQARPDLLAAYANDAAYQLQDTVDQYLAELLSEAVGTVTDDLGDGTTPLEINSDNVGATLRLIARKLDDAKVPRSGRVVVVPPWVVEDLVTANIAESTANEGAVSNGMVTRYAGFDVLMSHNVPNTAGDAHKIVAGAPLAATMAVQIDKSEQIRLPNTFADGVRGLMVYGAKVTRPGAVAVATCNEAVEG